MAFPPTQSSFNEALQAHDEAIEAATGAQMKRPSRPYDHRLRSFASSDTDASSTGGPSIFSRVQSYMSAGGASDKTDLTIPSPGLPSPGQKRTTEAIVDPFDDQSHVEEEPIPAQLQQESRPTIDLQVRDPVRKWQRGPTVPVPETVEVDEEEVHDYGARTAEAVRPQQGAPTDVISPIGWDQPAQPLREPKEDITPIVFPTTQYPAQPREIDVDGKLKKKGLRKIFLQKHGLQIAQLSINGFAIFATWWWLRYYYILLPFIMATVALNVAMVFSIAINRTFRAVFPEKKIAPPSPESLIMLVPCYNETKEELTRSLNSLTTQRNIDQHKQCIMIICDGKVRGPNMEKTTADYLLEDILLHRTSRKYLKKAYTAWDQGTMDVVIQRGSYQGVPYICIVKQQNQGKRDGLIIARSFLYNFNRRLDTPPTVFTPLFFNELANFLIDDADIYHADSLIGMDADTVFDENCISILIEESHYKNTVGVSGMVSVDWKDNDWNLWRLYQSSEYTIAQALRRLHQSVVTHKVSCLPGCCQLLKVLEETCGDEVLVELFGYYPKLTDGLLKNIRATASEDRNHVCHMLTARPESQTRQALQAKAYTEVPQSWSVFLSQRRRWTLGATSNDLMLTFARGTQWFERIVAAVNVEVWFMNPFIFASLASFIFAITGKFGSNLPLSLISAYANFVFFFSQSSPSGSSCVS